MLRIMYFKHEANFSRNKEVIVNHNLKGKWEDNSGNINVMNFIIHVYDMDDDVEQLLEV